MAVETQVRPSRWRYTYAVGLMALAPSPGNPAGAAASYVVNLPMNPRVHTVKAEGAVSETFTAGGVVIEEDGFIVHDIEVEGTCGLSMKRGQAADGTWIFADGNVLFEELNKVFDKWSEGKKNAAINATFVMTWHDFIRDRHYVVYPKQHEVPRDAGSSRIHRVYKFTLRAVGTVETTLRSFFDDGVLGDIRDAVTTAIDCLNAATGYAEDARAFIAEADAYVAGINRDAVAALDAMVAAGAGIITGVQRFMALPRRIADDWQVAIDRWVGALEAALETRPWLPGDPDAERNLAALDVARAAGDEVRILRANRDVWSPTFDEQAAERDSALEGATTPLTDAEIAAGGTAGAPGLASRVTPGTAARITTERSRAAGARPTRTRYTGQRAVTIRQGDTMVGIAVRELGSPSSWIDILDANPDLRPPYISAAGHPGTVGPGDTLIVPTAGGGTDLAGDGPALGVDPEAEFLGIDFELDANGEWLADSAASDGRKVRGVDNLVQAIERIKFRTPLGENLLYPHVGIVAPVGRPRSPGTPAAVALAARTVLAQDDRIAGINGIETVDAGDALYVEIDTTVRGSSGRRVLRQPVR